MSDADFDLADYDVLEIETGDVTPIPEPDGIGRIEVTRSTPGSTGQVGDGFARVLIQGYDTTRIEAIVALHGKARMLLETARKLLADAVAAGRLSDACASELDAFLDHLGLCIVGLPRTP